MDTSLDDDSPFDALLQVVPLCDAPNLLAIHRPAGGEALVLLTSGATPG